MLRSACRTTACTAAALAAFAAVPSFASTIAVTEFMYDPWSSDSDYEWVELFNYGASAVDLDGWTMKDNSSGVYTFGAYTIGSGDYIVVARNKSFFEGRWLGGAADSRVMDGMTFQINNSVGDGIYLRDGEGELVWSLGYTLSAGNFDGDAGPYRATFLTGDDFSLTNYGIPPQDGAALIIRNGNDIGLDGLGYQGNEFTTDAFAWDSGVGDGGNEFGSPLSGHYTAVPEPASLVLLAAGGALIVTRRRTA